MIVDQTHRLDEGEDGGRADEFPAALFEVFRDGDRFWGGCDRLRWRQGFFVRLVAPEIRGERTLGFDHFLCAFCVVYRGFDLAAMTDDRGILEQALDIFFFERGDAIVVETMENASEIFPLGEDRAPAETRLKSFKTDFFEQASVIDDRESPFRIVITDVLGVTILQLQRILASGPGTGLGIPVRALFDCRDYTESPFRASMIVLDYLEDPGRRKGLLSTRNVICHKHRSHRKFINPGMKRWLLN